MNKPVLLGVWMLLLVSSSLASAPFPGMEFYGKVVHQGKYARPGTLITAHFLDGTICGETTVETVGQYTKLSCNPNSFRVGEQVVFRINYDKASTIHNQSYIPGTMKHVDVFTGNLKEAQVVLREIPKYTMCSECLIRAVVIAIFALLVLMAAFELGKWTKKKYFYG